MSPHESNQALGLSPLVATAAVASLAALIFAADLTIASDYAVWVLYLPLCVFVAWSRPPREAITLGAMVTILVAAAWFLSVASWHIAVGRALEVLTIWLSIGLLTLRKRTETAAQAEREARIRLATILDNADDAIISIDENQNITLFNSGAEKIFDYTAAEVVGRNLKLLLPARATEAHAKFVSDFGRSRVQARRMGERGAVAGRRKDGSEFPAEVSISKSVLHDGIAYTAILRDVTERVKADQLLRDREQRLGLALTAGRMGTFQIDEQSGIAKLDQTGAQLVGLEPGDIPSGDRFRTVYPDDRPLLRDALQQLRDNGGGAHTEFRVQTAAGGIRWIAVDASVELDSDGKPRQTTGVLRDITERKEIEKSLEARVAERTTALREEIARREEAQTALVRSQKLQAVGELAGGIAHDFNNLLTVITGNLELLGFRQLDDKARDHIRRADEAAKMGARLAGRLLAIGRKQRLQPIALDLNEIAKSMSDVLKRTLGDTIAIETSFAGDLWHATADVSEVENAILNLAVNARDAMPHGGKLVIQTANTSLGADDVVGEAGLKPGDYVLLSVSDTGVGMSAEVLARALEPYFTTKEPGRGTGLGLSTIYGFAKQLGGHLTIYSEVGKGTSVKLYLPRSGEAAAAETAAAAALHAQAEGETILVVEDNADVRDVTMKRLDMLGYRVLVAENAPRAVEVLKAGAKIDLVFSDVVMPGGMSGFDLANWIRVNRPEIKVLLTSGFTGEVARSGEADAADIDVLRKPYATADLARAVREALNP
jgi:PAS domain S-box-containing protein